MMANVQTLSKAIGKNLKACRGGRSQEDLARDLQAHGLGWTRATVAALETGARGIELGEFVLLCHALALTPDDLLEGSDAVIVAEQKEDATAVADLSAIRSVLAGRTGTIGFSTPEVNAAMLRADVLRAAAWTEPPAIWRQWWPSLFDDLENNLSRVIDAAQGLAAASAARTLGIPLDDLAVASLGLWGRSLADERDAQVDNFLVARSKLSPTARGYMPLDSEDSQRSRQAMRGHTTRKLLAELKHLFEGTDNGER